MKFSIERSALVRTLAHVQSVVERRNTIPILSNVRMEGEDSRLRLTATDMDLELVEAVAAAIEAEGAVTVPAHTLYDIARKLPEGADVAFDASGGADSVHVRSGRSRFTLPCLPITDFPVMAGGDLPCRFTIAAGELRNLIDRTRFAISTEETRYYLNGIYLHRAETEGAAVLRAVATDGHRLAMVDVPPPEGVESLPGVIVPRKTVNEVRRLIDETAGDIECAVSETKIRFAFGETVLTSKLIDGSFPDYQRVIPTGNDKTLEVKCKEFTEAIDRVSAISSEKSRAVKLSADDGVLVVSASSPEYGQATEEVEVRYDGARLDIGFNSRYLLDITQQLGGEHARLTLADASSPTILHDVGDASALYVLMPMRV